LIDAASHFTSRRSTRMFDTSKREPRDKSILVRATAAEKKHIEKLARQSGAEGVTDFVRTAIREKADRMSKAAKRKAATRS